MEKGCWRSETRAERKKVLTGSFIDPTQESTSELEDKQKSGVRGQKRLSKHPGTSMHMSSCRKQKQQEGAETTSAAIMTEKLPKSMSDTNSQRQEAHRTTSRIHANKTKPQNKLRLCVSESNFRKSKINISKEARKEKGTLPYLQRSKDKNNTRPGGVAQW